ncbi:uncharacterized protein LOC129788334 [Lutzomyia longipalpis]|uniref:uncharacterized protein LOC129788334 n=1 Tax=Lutzomyia longipalpis TaxID=7200 RepID=UPI002483C5D6|nr:uncharacterized protein LOC129788334 [Lutzomyia longipalpis]
MGRILLFIALLIFGVSQVFGTKCYDCRDQSSDGSSTNCADLVDVSKIKKVDCGSNQQCYTMKVDLQIDGLNQTVQTSRGCISKSLTDCNSIFPFPWTTITSCDICDKDYCNNSVKLTGKIYAVLPMIISLLIAKTAF